MNFSPCPIEGAFVVETNRYRDLRGAFSRLYCEQELEPLLAGRRILQINHSRTAALGAIRGMHYQRQPHAEMKFIRCLRGRVWDVMLDLRQGSQTFLQWHAEELSEDNFRMVVIPEGCAHGFQVLEPNSELLYLHTAFYTPDSEGAIAYDDPAVAVKWPLPVSDLSLRDRQHPFLTSQFSGLTI